MNEDCLFCNIVSGEIKGIIVFRDDIDFSALQAELSFEDTITFFL